MMPSPQDPEIVPEDATLQDVEFAGVTASSKNDEVLPVETAEELPVPDEKLHRSSSHVDSTGSRNNDMKESCYPKAFYCPLTEELFQDPVVKVGDGLSYDKAALEALGGDDANSADTRYYANRVLKSIIDETVEHKTSSSLRRFGHNVRQLSQQLMNEYHRPLPDGYYCPITLSLIHVPVIDPEGYSYEKVAIENWIRCNGVSPVTRRTMSVDDLVPNRTLTALMEEEVGKSDETMHPVFKQWKEEPVPTFVATDMENNGSSAHASVTTFPTTPEQLAEINRTRRIRRYQRCHLWCILFIALAIMAWLVPFMATVILVVILVSIGVISGYSSSSGGFRNGSGSA